MSTKFLKVKIKSLADEARTIRLEERRAGQNEALRNKLYLHRTVDVRGEQRATLLAYAYLRGRPLAAVEPRRASEPKWDRVAKMVEKYGPAGSRAGLDAWKAAAPAAA